MLIAVLVAAAASLNDPQIATIALTAHQIDVDRGKLALKHTKNDEVKQFAEQMVNDHQAGIAEAMALASACTSRRGRATSRSRCRRDAKKATARLKKEKGKTFDKDYIDTEVAYPPGRHRRGEDRPRPRRAKRRISRRCCRTRCPPWRATSSTQRWSSRQVGKNATASK